MSHTLAQRNKTNIMTFVCMMAFFLSNISYLPYFTESGTTQYLSYPGWGLMAATVFMHRRLYLSVRDMKLTLSVVVSMAIMLVIQLITGKNYFSALLTKCILIATAVFVLGCMVSRTEKTWGMERKLVFTYILAACLLCAVVYLGYLRGQDISSRLFSYTSKNETSFVAVSAIIMLLYMPRQHKDSKLMTCLRAVLIVFLLYVIANMRCRSMLVSSAVVFAVFLFQKSSSRRIKTLVVLGFGILLIALQHDGFYNTFVNNILLAGRDKNDTNDISSGRLTQIGLGLQKLWDNLLLGTGDTGTIDCFYVSVLMQYGVFLGTFFIGLGCYPCIWGIINYKRIRSPLCIIMTMCALVYMIGGMFEENAPFGPGVRCYISWFLFGYLRVQQSQGYFEGKNDENYRVA